MQHASNRWLNRFVAMGLLAMTLASASAIAASGPPSTGLGQSWPNATDVSASPHWHVYVFERNGVRYVQINDLSGKVRAAVAASSGNFLALPIGTDASHLATPQEPLPLPASTAGETVYQDSALKMFVAPQSNGTLLIFTASGDCTDPIECSSRIN